MTSLAAPKAMIFTSDCVDVIEMESEPWIESYWVITRPCSAARGCYDTDHCPAWQRALKAMGGWVEHHPPDWQVVADRGEEFMVSRVVIDLPLQHRPHDHWAWEAMSGPLAPRAANFLSMGLEMGDEVFVICTPELCEELKAMPSFNAAHPNLHWRDANDMLVSRAGPDGRITVDSFWIGHAGSPLDRLLRPDTKVWVFTNHLYLLYEQGRWDEAMVVEAAIGQLVMTRDLSVACAVPNLTEIMRQDAHYEELCRHHARMVVVTTDE